MVLGIDDLECTAEHANTMPLYIRESGIQILVFAGVLGQFPCGYEGITVLV